MRVLISAPYMTPFMDRFRPLLEGLGFDVVVPEVRERLEEKDLLAVIGDVDGVICGDDRFTERVIAAAPRLRVISKWGTGIDSIDSAAAERRGIRVARTPGAFTEPVADSVLGYMLCFARRIPWMDRTMKRGEWVKLPGRSLGECTLGIVGVGDIGRAVARRARTFGMDILGTDIRPIPEEVVAQASMRVVGLEELLAGSDFVSLNCDLNPTSHHLVNATTLGLMKPGAYLINTARGPIVEQSALVDALTRRSIAGVALDVFEGEPLPPDHPFLAFDSCLYAAHNANSSPRAWERVHRNTIDNLVRVLKPDVRVDWTDESAHWTV